MAPIATTAAAGLAVGFVSTPGARSRPFLSPALLHAEYAGPVALIIRRKDDVDTHSLTYGVAGFIGGILVLFFVIFSIRHFRKGGTWKEYFTLLRSIAYAAVAMIFVSLFLVCIIGFNDYLKARSARAAPANNAGAARNVSPSEPLPMNRPQMPLDPVVLVPESSDLDDPDAIARIRPPPPAHQNPETTSEATADMLDSNPATPACAPLTTAATS